MSYQRAVVNCRRCYEFANWPEQDSEVGRLRNETLWTARNEAMKALEEISIKKHNELCYELECEEKLEANIAKALDACMNCDYKKAQIAEIFDPKKKKD